MYQKSGAPRPSAKQDAVWWTTTYKATDITQTNTVAMSSANGLVSTG